MVLLEHKDMPHLEINMVVLEVEELLLMDQVLDYLDKVMQVVLETTLLVVIPITQQVVVEVLVLMVLLLVEELVELVELE